MFQLLMKRRISPLVGGNLSVLADPLPLHPSCRITLRVDVEKVTATVDTLSSRHAISHHRTPNAELRQHTISPHDTIRPIRNLNCGFSSVSSTASLADGDSAETALFTGM